MNKLVEMGTELITKTRNPDLGLSDEIENGQTFALRSKSDAIESSAIFGSALGRALCEIKGDARSSAKKLVAQVIRQLDLRGFAIELNGQLIRSKIDETHTFSFRSGCF